MALSTEPITQITLRSGVELHETLSVAKHRDLGELRRTGARILLHGAPEHILSAAYELLDSGEWRWAQLCWTTLMATPGPELGLLVERLPALFRRICESRGSVDRKAVAW